LIWGKNFLQDKNMLGRGIEKEKRDGNGPEEAWYGSQGG